MNVYFYKSINHMKRRDFGMRVSCCSCKTPFHITAIHTEDMGEGIEKVYITCPICRQKFVGYYTDESIRNLQKKIRKAAPKLRNEKYDQKVLKKRIAKLQKQMKSEMDALRKQIEVGAEKEQEGQDGEGTSKGEASKA
ncbi:hypothetical protein [Paenibacillus melissococcoides]|nr:hypothetical protein [Paenibacillus melissococcoides]